ncbi:LacI family DNA-binding transcriptional regulator [Kiloniella laminariae]|uniref:LacI family DNA-binding transcriptional regulator n=1 Tax=Kiloniella laminariae TaxID=454162 RepID=A0ABT4LGP6_9PROT|nr:LacI family DNA-binding transcriptional regulator [Kiloniella laminariae]MCZ4280279.1 LacI family DNA-binding transcriptional regulator [Kiloniella laminariae]
MATIKDVAQLAGVSVGTVSRVLAKNETVKPRLQEKVEAAVRELRYKPNPVARALRTNRSDIIGLIVPDITNPFFAQLAKQVEMLAAGQGLSVMLANTHDDPAYEKQQIETLLDRSPLGILVVSASEDNAQQLATDIPIVALDRTFVSYPCVATDHEVSASLAALHLLEMGHLRIGYAAGPSETRVARARESGFVAGLTIGGKDLGVKPDLEILRGAFDFTAGEELGRIFLNRPVSQRPTAIATASDQQAIGIMRAARDLKIEVPHELTVVGFDDIPLAVLVTPRLSTIRQSISQMASSALDLLVQSKGIGEDIKYPGRLIVRGSSGPAPVF